LLDNNKPAQAAPIFAKLAEVLTSAKQPRRAASLHAQAALAFAKSRNESALMQARATLTLMLQYKLDQQASAFYEDLLLLREFTKRGMQPAAEALRNEFAARVAPAPASVNPHAAQFARLPSNCPHCGAPLRSEEVHWVDARTVECAFCGTPVRYSLDKAFKREL
jgi:endogenous inhibitor of DNA gyrase (YacG/DUF329 family)